MNKYYTGIGSRKTPESAIKQMRQLGCLLAKNKYILRSGNAEGADAAFYEGHIRDHDQYEVYIPWKKFGVHQDPNFIVLDQIEEKMVEKAISIAYSVHGGWNNLSQGAKKLHTRNVFQVLGKDLESPSEVVICWTEGGKVKGGTATAIKIAQQNNIPVWNLGCNGFQENTDLFN